LDLEYPWYKYILKIVDNDVNPTPLTGRYYMRRKRQFDNTTHKYSI